MATRKKRSSTCKPLPASKRRSIEKAHSVDSLQDLATKLRIHSIEATTAAGSGHPSSCASLAEIFAVLYFDASGMRYFPDDPRNLANDKLVLSKGHAAPILYAAWALNGHIPISELTNLRTLHSDLEGHPTPRLDFCDIATGSLGQGLSAACGMAYSIKYFEKTEARVYCVIGDGESAEGSVWEAFHFASFRQLDNLVAIIDVNRLGQSEETSIGHDIDIYKQRLESFGWHTIIVDGHEITEIISALDEARTVKNKPTALVARTIKGKDFIGIEDQLDWHGKPLGSSGEAVLAQLRAKLKPDVPAIQPPQPANSFPLKLNEPVAQVAPTYTVGTNVATRNAYGDGLRAIGADERVVGLDGDTKNSTFSITFMKEYPQRFIECYIAEQNLVGVSLGLATRGMITFCSTFATFFSRAFDFIRMGAVSRTNANFCGSHCGVSIGEDGPSQMGLEDIAMFRTIPGALVLYPSDATSAFRAVQLAANHNGVSYIRTSRPANPVIYSAETVISPISYVLASSPDDRLTIIGAGITLHEALSAHAALASEGIHVRVIDLFVVKPLDVATLLAAAKETHSKVLTVEDHYPEGGIYEAVSGALSPHNVHVESLAVHEIPRSGKPNELVEKYGLSSSCIVRKVKELLAQ